MIKPGSHSGIKIYSLDTTLLNKWVIKASITEEGVICLVLFNIETYDLTAKFFDDEEDAHSFIIDFVNLDQPFNINT